MPTYEYICRACGHEFEEFQSIKADPIAVCPKCRKRKVERKIGMGGAVIFKGGGFYETDYRSEGYKSAADADKKASEAKAETTPDAKTAPGPESKAERTPGGRQEAKSEAKPEAAPQGKAEPKVDSKPDAAAAAENKRIEARATHQSRIGRGVGNIVRKKAPPRKKR
jgi:putative FmdB family regulatory protein